MNVWFREDVSRILLAVAAARAPLTTDDVRLLQAIATAFGLSLDFKQFFNS